MEYRLLEKTELWIEPVRLKRADLQRCAEVAASVLDLESGQVAVTDAMGERLTLDLLVPTVRAERIIGRQKQLLHALSEIPGLEILPETQVHSKGVLGLISIDEACAKEFMERSRSMAEQIAERLRKRCIVFPTGRELLEAQIRDANTPFLIEVLSSEGYQVTEGPVLEDHKYGIARAFRLAAESGYGLAITTGGIGAEKKDQTLEALCSIDPGASLSHVLKFKKGAGRHHKEGVRLGVGRLEQTRIVCLPGPHDEVHLLWPVLKEGLRENWQQELLSARLAEALRKKFMDRASRAAKKYDHEELGYGTE